jgi:hypothetical protein
MIGLKEVYKIDTVTGEIRGLEDISSVMAPTIPKCPHCQRPIRQYATQRYNRLINRAVIDEMSKRFIVTGQSELQGIETRLAKTDHDLQETRADIVGTNFSDALFLSANPNFLERAIKQVAKKLDGRYKPCAQLRSAVLQLQRRAAERHQPAHKLREATIHALQRDEPLESALVVLNLEHSPSPKAHDQRITLGAKMLQIKVESLALEDKFRILSGTTAKYGVVAATSMLSQNSPSPSTGPFLKDCAKFVTTCKEELLPKLGVEASLYYARVARLFETSGITEPKDRKAASEYHEQAQTLLEQASKLCEQGFRDADILLEAVNEALKLLSKEWYENVTDEELKSIKMAMITGPRGIATHSGHWYNCVNGHPVCFLPFGHQCSTSIMLTDV